MVGGNGMTLASNETHEHLEHIWFGLTVASGISQRIEIRFNWYEISKCGLVDIELDANAKKRFRTGFYDKEKVLECFRQTTDKVLASIAPPPLLGKTGPFPDDLMAAMTESLQFCIDQNLSFCFDATANPNHDMVEVEVDDFGSRAYFYRGVSLFDMFFVSVVQYREIRDKIIEAQTFNQFVSNN